MHGYLNWVNSMIETVDELKCIEGNLVITFPIRAEHPREVALNCKIALWSLFILYGKCEKYMQKKSPIGNVILNYSYTNPFHFLLSEMINFLTEMEAHPSHSAVIVYEI